MAAIHRHKKIDIRDMGGKPTYVSNILKKQTGYSVVGYINHYRIMKAKLMLGDPQNKIYWVIEQIGLEIPVYYRARRGE